MKTTMKDIADIAGVSRTTVSRVLSGNYKKIRISAGTAEKILNIAREHDFQPDDLAKSLQSRKTKTIGVIVTDITNPFFAEIAGSIEKHLTAENYSMLLLNTREELEAEKKAINLFLSKRVEGLIICPSGIKDENICRLAGKHIPFVLIDRYVKGFDSSYVVSDNYNGAKKAVLYLIGKGHKRIGFLGGRVDSSSNLERKQGYCDALSENGIKYLSELELNLGFDKESGEKGMELFLKLKERPTAVFAANNFLGLGALLSLKKHGINVSGEISLLEFDETDLSRFGDTAITSVNQNAKEMGEKAAEIILRKIAGGKDERVIVPVKMIERESVSAIFDIKPCSARVLAREDVVLAEEADSKYTYGGNMEKFNGLGMNLGNLSRLSDAKTRSISPENFDGEKGKGGMSTDGPSKLCARGLGQGWKVSPYIRINAGETVTIADIKGPGAIQHIWMTPAVNHWRFAIIRVYWDGQKNPSIECPIGDFFCNPMGKYKQVSSLAVCTNPFSGLNSYWEMPFKKSCKITVENIDENRKEIYKEVENAGKNEGKMVLYYQIDYTLTEVPVDCGYFHAQFRRTNPLPYKQDYTILDGVKGKGQYVGTYMLWGLNSDNWWGEGEIKFFMDGDKKFPTICGTGTEDYFCGSYDFENADHSQYAEFSTPYSGVSVHKPDGFYKAVQRFSMYRWHIADPIRFEKELKVTIQALGWRNDGRYLPLQDDISSVAFWYQTLPSAKLEPLPEKDQLEIACRK